jgi:N-acetylglucosaminyldiphosphoundecaprenol N-acetyl-beta-D-mannosaminyltransferase
VIDGQGDGSLASLPADGVHAPPTTDVLGARVFVGDLDEAASLVVRRAVSGEGGFVCQCNVHLLVEAGRHREVMAALEGAWCVFPDGAPVAWLERWLRYSEARRVPGPDLMLRVLDDGRREGLRHFFLGSTEETLVRLRARIASLLPGVAIVGHHAPPVVDRWGPEPEITRAINEADAHVIWCALGAPKQELWMLQHAPTFPSLLIGVGAAFDFHAGAKRRAPRWMQRSGLEWLHRLSSEPRRLGPRYVSTNVEFVARAGAEVARRRVREGSGRCRSR